MMPSPTLRTLLGEGICWMCYLEILALGVYIAPSFLQPNRQGDDCQVEGGERVVEGEGEGA